MSSTSIEHAIHKNNRYDAVRSTVQLFENAILDHYRTDERRPDVWLVVVPEIIHRYGRPQVGGTKDTVPSNVMSEKIAAGFLRAGGSLFPDMSDESQLYLFARNFHHQLKAQLLHKQVVIQVVRETTLDPSLEQDRFGNPVRSVQEPARMNHSVHDFLETLEARRPRWFSAEVGHLGPF